MMVNQGWVEVVSPDAPHLGGNILFGDPRTFSPNVWNYMIDRFGIESVLDVGSGLGYASRYFFRKGLQVIAVEGLAENVRGAIFPTVLHDLTKGPIETRVDLVHCQEVVEHIEEQFLENLLRSLMCGKYILMTNALPGQGGHHHVNEQPTEYWIDHLSRRGCHVLVPDTNRIRDIARAEGAPYFAATGVLFANGNRF
jgi:SAM-dependent methyltransferase